MITISNHYHPEMVRPKLDVKMQAVFEPTDEWNYAHHPFITRYLGKLFLCFSSGKSNEDDVGQRIVYMVADDFEHWSDPKVLATPNEALHEVLIPAGLYHDGKRLIVYYHKLAYSSDVLKPDGHRRMGSQGRSFVGFYYKETYDGLCWSEETAFDHFGGNMSVRVLKSGRLFSCGGRTCAYSDCKDGIHGWKETEICPPGYGNKPEDVRPDDDMPGLVSDTHVSLCEASCIQQDSGRLWLYLRSATPYLWATYSDDEGETWVPPEKTDFTDNRTKFCMDRLPDGRYYYVGTPDPFPPRTRHLLALSLSKDGLDWTEHYLLADAQYKGRYPAIDKNGVYGYPSVLVENNDMYVAVSITKEMIAVMHTNLEGI